METTLETTTDPGYRLTPTGLTFSRDLTDFQWETLGRKVVQLANGSIWAFGDWLVYGFGKGPLSETYTLAQILSGRFYDSLCQMARVSEAFPHATRTVRVSWSHYREAMRLAPEDRLDLLAEAAKARWSRDKLSQAIENHLAIVVGREARQIRGGGRPERKALAASDTLEHARAKSTGPRTNVLMQCPNCKHSWTARLSRAV